MITNMNWHIWNVAFCDFTFFHSFLVTNSPVAVFYKVMKMSWFSKKLLEKISSTAKYRYRQTRRRRKKNRIKSKKTKDINVFC